MKEKPIDIVKQELYEVLADNGEYKCESCGWVQSQGGLCLECERADSFLQEPHEPTLENILLKLRESRYESVTIDTVGNLHINDCKNVKIKYNLTKSFDNQSEETLWKLHELLTTQTLANRYKIGTI